MIWLDDNNDDYHWVNQNLIGMPIGMNGGYNLSNNSACTIHGATSSVTTGTYDVVLVLDIEFLQTGTWYMYESVQNNQGKVNPSQSGGNPPWSYWGYWPVS